MRTSNLVCLGTPLYVFIHTCGFGSCTSSSKAVPPLPPTDCTENTSERNIRSALHWCVRPTAVDWVFKSCWEAVKQAVNITHRIDSADAEDTIPLDPPTVCRRVKMYVRIIADGCTSARAASLFCPLQTLYQSDHVLWHWTATLHNNHSSASFSYAITITALT